MGEHAVLHGQPALCAAVSRRVYIELSEGERGRYRIESELGTAEGDLNTLVPAPPLHFVLEAVRETQTRRGFHMKIRSDISSTIGFGTSSAVCVAAVAALQAWKEEPFDRAHIFKTALKVVRSVQGRASGADVAAATFGGVVEYTADPVSIEPLVCTLPLVAVYCGYKRPTAEVIQIVEQGRAVHPDLYAQLYDAMGTCVRQATRAIRSGDLEQLGELFQIHQGLQKALGTEDETLSHLLYTLEALPSVLGAKISGSGLGDCVIALGDSQASIHGYDSTPVEIDSHGVQLSNGTTL
jgi:mevalonate kinase